MVKTSYVINLGSKDPIYDTAPLVVWGHAEIAVTIIAASIPVLRVLAKDASLTFWTRRRTNSQGNSGSYKSGPSTDNSQRRLRVPLSKGSTTISSMAMTTSSATPLDQRRNKDDDKGYDGVCTDTFSTILPQRGRGMTCDGSSEREMLSIGALEHTR